MMKSSSAMTLRHLATALLASAALLALPWACASTAPSAASESPAAKAPEEAPETSIDADRLYAALVRVQTVAVPNARSNTTLGREREGTGTIIGKEGVILTIGYLLVEAEDVKVTDARGRTHGARVLAYDHATGLGLPKSNGCSALRSGSAMRR